MAVARLTQYGAVDANAIINDTLLTVRDALLTHVLDAYRQRFGRGALAQVIDALKSDHHAPSYADMEAVRSAVDPSACFDLIVRGWREVFGDNLDEVCLSYVSELRRARAGAAHFEPAPTDADLYRFVDTAVRLLEGFRALGVDGAAAESLSRKRAELLQRMTAPAAIIDADIEGRIAELVSTWSRSQVRAEVVRLLHLLKPADAPLPLLVAPRALSWTDDQPRLVISAPEHFHRADGASPLLAALDRWEAAGVPMRRAVFLALDAGAALRLGELVRRWLALTRISMIEGALADADSGLRAALTAVGAQIAAQIAAAYCWCAVRALDSWRIDLLPPVGSLGARAAQAAGTG
jgi:hypothetical protein